MPDTNEIIDDVEKLVNYILGDKPTQRLTGANANKPSTGADAKDQTTAEWIDPHAKERPHKLDEAPRYADKAAPGTHDCTDYSPKGNGPKNEVYRVTSNLSFISSVLIIITEDKHFEDLTGQDGLTMGIGDFASGSDLEFVSYAYRLYPTLVAEAFGADKAKMALDNGAAYLHQKRKEAIAPKIKKVPHDHGLITLDWLRKGIARILADRRFNGIQLDFWTQDKVHGFRRDGALPYFQKNGFKLEFTLAAMCGMCNSGGPGGMRKWINRGLAAAKGTGIDKEIHVMRTAVEEYALLDKDEDAAKAAVAHIFDGGPRPKDIHHVKRMVLTNDWFPVKAAKEFDGNLGEFDLEDGEKAPSAPTQSPPAPLPDRALSTKGHQPKRHKPEERRGG